MPGEINIKGALELIESRTVKDRSDGFRDLRHILRRTGSSSLLQDASIHRIYEALFRVAYDDRATYLKALTPATRSAAENRLSACAAALRDVVERTVRLARLKTLRAVLDHVTQMFASPDGLPCEPLALDYAKCLRALLSYQPHVEHLKPEERETYALFCVQSIETARSNRVEDDTEPGAEVTSTAGTINGQSYRSSRSHYKESSGSQGGRSMTKQIAEEMVGCLAALTAVPSASMGIRTPDILRVVLGFLQNTTSTRKSNQDAFAVVNHLLSRSTTQDTSLTRQNLSQLIRLIRIYWSLKPTEALKNELLITYIFLRPYIFAAMQTRENLTLHSELSTTLDVIRNEYSKRKERDRLHMDNIRMVTCECSEESTTNIATRVYSLRCVGAHAEANWTTLHMMASLCDVLSVQNGDESSSENEDDEVDLRPGKRQRMTSDLDDVLSSSLSGTHEARITSLQTLTFLAQQRPFSIRHLKPIIEKVSSSCYDDNGDVLSWALMTLASFAAQKVSCHQTLSSRWSVIWQLATRAISNASTCRPACHLLYIVMRTRLVPMQIIVELFQTITVSMDLNGPAVLADSVAKISSYALQLSQQTNPTTTVAAAESVLNWLFRTLTPSEFKDRDYASQQALFEAADVIELINICLGKQPSAHSGVAQHSLWGPVGQAWLLADAQSELVEYLLLLPRATADRHSALAFLKPVVTSAQQSRTSCQTIVLTNMISESHRTQESWGRMALKNMSRDMITFFCKACHITASIALCYDFRDVRRQMELQKQSTGLLNSLAEFAKTSMCPQDNVDAMLLTFSSAFCCLQVSRPGLRPCLCELALCRCVAAAMEARQDSLEPSGRPNLEDLMELDEDFDSQDSRRTERSSCMQDLQNDSAVAFGVFALRAKVTFYALTMNKQQQAQNESMPTDSATTQILDAVLDFESAMIFAGRSVISRLPDLGVNITAEDASRLTEFCMQHLEIYQFERCEVALGAILDIMASTTAAWTDRTNKHLYEDGLDIYNWYIRIGLPNRALSPNVQRRLASLLLQLCNFDLDYGKNDSCPSARTSIFELISMGSTAVQFHLASRISAIFGLFILSNHAIMFDDLRETLPKDTSDTEGIAMRLLFFSKLASAWHSLLRECVFYIVETAGQSNSATNFAARGILELSQALHFDTPQKLFRLFAPQLLHSWLEGQSVTSVPFAIFQYESLEALVSDCLSEITAQLLVRHDKEGLAVVTAALKLTTTEVMKKCFAKCEAYCISYDISKPTAEIESRLRAELGGKEQLRKLAVSQYPAILAQFFLSTQNEGVEDNSLDKRGGYNEETKALREIKAYSHSTRALPVCQQPSFKSKWLCDQIERLCRRVGRTDPSQRWDPSAFAFVARQLLDSIDDALGPLHTCLVIRRLRLLICLAGDVAFTGYQLEMLIRALRPYLNDSQCADDVIGVLQYLFRRGQTYLKTQLSFLRGNITLMVLQMRKHSGARQESTTQESQHRATVQKMQNFHEWLVDYLKACQPHESSAATEHTMLVQSLLHARLPGNASQSTPESALLLLLLSQADDGEVFRVGDKEEALFMLAANFDVPPSTADDCLKEDKDCVRLAQQLWQVCRMPALDTGFLRWAAGALGRAYAASGKRPSIEQKSLHYKLSTGYEGIAMSQAAIARRLTESLYRGNKMEASIADRTLRDALLSFDDANDALVFENMLPPSVVSALEQSEYGYAPSLFPLCRVDDGITIQQFREPSTKTTVGVWIQRFSIHLCVSAKRISILPALPVALRGDASLSIDLFPAIVHIILASELDRELTLRAELSSCIAVHLAYQDVALIPKQAYLLKLLLYLRAQRLPEENTQTDRLRWLEVDWLQAAEAAIRCAMPRTALLFAESASVPSSGNRRSSSRASPSQVTMKQVSPDLLLSIFKDVDEPDSFYGVEQAASLDAILERFDYEADGLRSLMFRSAQKDTQLLRLHQFSPEDSVGMVRSLSTLNLNSLTFSLLSGGSQASTASRELLNSARKLQQWDTAVPEEANGAASSCFKLFQELSRAHDRATMRARLHSILLDHLSQAATVAVPMQEWFGALASIVEVDEVMGSSGQSAIRSTWERLQHRQDWMHLSRFDDVNIILVNRQIMFSTLARNRDLLVDMRGAIKDSRAIEIEALLNVSAFAREHNRLQEALNSVSQAGALIPACEETGLKIVAAVNMETASVLWHAEEATASVKMVQETLEMSSLEQQDIEALGRAGLLARLAHQLAEARLEKPDSILSQQLEPAIKHLRGRFDGAEAGEVFHEFATFCDKQLQSPGNTEDLERMARLRQKKLDELTELDGLMKSSRKREQQESYYNNHKKAKKWFDIDDADYQKLKRSRDTYMQQSLQNYMLTLRATNKYNISALRLFALWLENADVAEANHIASKYLSGIPSWKFVLLMNQLMSRLESDGSTFQKALSTLLFRICSEHPHHSLHHLFATTRNPGNGELAAMSRHKAASTIRAQLTSDPEKGRLLERTFSANKLYIKLAYEDGSHLSKGATTKDLISTNEMRQKIPKMQVPPITINLPLRPNGDYSEVPVISHIGSSLRVMSGLSRPKAVSVYGTDGRQYSQLFKSGNDDLRQDAIMEQVFEEVSKMLRNHKATRQRNLVVRTYKVIPLGPTSGAIEFVPNSMSFSEFLKPAHETYYPQDYKDSKARSMVSHAKDHSTEVRIKEFRKVCEHMHPVTRHFFFERFNDPDEWFQKRTSYTRTTATISILGHVLGLGDRHCQNIMLDEKTGEVVHIDLGVAFEAGRVLPIPELVPFRLSRDVVDGMGITKTEGVFRRCCEFTMDALREDKNSIMTLLNVLRYDPLYTWTVSPLRAKRMQEETGREGGPGAASKRRDHQEAGEAERALSIVEKKLSKTLSTAATVNELIQQATDERNLATLFSGWSAWF